MAVIEERLDHVEAEMLQRKAEHREITRRLDRRRHWWVTLCLAAIAMALAAMGGSYLASRSVVREVRAREEQGCQQRNEFRSASRLEIEVLLPLMSLNNPARAVLQNLHDTTFAPVDC